MRTILSNALRIVILFVFFTQTLDLKAQVIITPNSQVCPNITINYTVSGLNLPSCSGANIKYAWAISGGTINSGNSGDGSSTANVTWNDNSGTRTLDVTITRAEVKNSNGDVVCSAVLIPATFTGGNSAKVKNLGSNDKPTIAIPTPARFIANFEQDINIGADLFNYPNVPDTEIETYLWTFGNGGTGWSFVQDPGVTDRQKGVLKSPRSMNSVTVCVGARSNCGNNSMASGTSCTTLVPFVPTPSTPSGPAVVTCGNTTPITYSVPAVPGATSYTWTIPGGWSAPSLTTTTPSITVTPNGTDGGSITVTAVTTASNVTLMSNVSATLAVSIVITTNTVTATGPALFCSAGTYVLEGAPVGPSITWNTNNLLNNPNSPPYYNPHLSPTTGNGATATINNLQPPTYFGDDAVNFRIVPPDGCAAQPIIRKINFHYGVPTLGGPKLDGVPVNNAAPWAPLQVCPGSHYVQLTQVTGGFGGLTWAITDPPMGNNVLINPGLNNTCDLFVPFSGPDYFTLRASTTNICGTANFFFFFSKKKYGCGQRPAELAGGEVSVFPNPATDLLTVTLDEMLEEQSLAEIPNELSAYVDEVDNGLPIVNTPSEVPAWYTEGKLASSQVSEPPAITSIQRVSILDMYGRSYYRSQVSGTIVQIPLAGFRPG
jgi:hypothetical protein